MKKPAARIVFLAISFFLTTKVFAEQTYIPVGEAKARKSVVAFPETKAVTGVFDSATSQGFVRAVRETINADLAFTNLFTIQNPSAFIEKPGAGLTLDSFKLSDWSSIGTDYVIKSGVSVNNTTATYEVRMYNVPGAKQAYGKRYSADVSEPKLLGHTIANDILAALTGRGGLFSAKLAMVCDKTGTKEIWVTEFDGSNPRQLTNHRTLAFAPDWSYDNKKIAYSVFMKNSKNIKNIDLFEMDLAARKARLLSNRKGINSGARYSPDGNHIAMTMSFLGNPEIFLLNRNNLEVSRMTKSLGFDVDPAFSPDGKRLAFVSSRSGQPHVYMMDVGSGNATRLTFAGKYNATPDWAPVGGKLVFAGYLENHFDIFMMNTDGTGLERLTKNEGNNEDPHFSPDGNFIAFSSNRSGQKNIYIISIDGMYTRRLSYGLGNCTSPKWTHSTN